MTYFTAEEAAEKLHMGLDAVRRKAAEGSIPARKVGKRWLFHPELLDKYMRNEWQSINERPGGRGGFESQYAASLFAEAPEHATDRKPRNSKPRSVTDTGGKRN